jgi:hypothetical protein
MSEAVEVIEKLNQMGSGIADKVQAVLGTIAEKVGQGVEHFWPVFIRQQFVVAIFGLIMILLGVGCTILFLKMGFKFMKAGKWTPQNYGCDIPDLKKLSGIISTILGTITLLASLIGTAAGGYTIVTGLLNPEYAAIHDVVQMVVGMK